MPSLRPMENWALAVAIFAKPTEPPVSVGTFFESGLILEGGNSAV
jgi:hypothetical protein